MKHHNAKTAALIAASKFFSLAEAAASTGGFWVSAAGGTANVVAGVIATATGVSFEEAKHCLHLVGVEEIGEDWYQYLADIQPFHWDDYYEETPGRWDAKTIAESACEGSGVLCA